MSIEAQTTLIPPSFFHEPIVFDREIEKLFHASWVFVGFTDHITMPEQYMTFDYFGEPVVIKNFSGTLRAFLNICSHRFSKICLEKQGMGPLQCPYHGWTYDHAGAPYAIPRKKQFGEMGDMSSLALKAFQVETVGRFIFLKSHAVGPNLKAYLGETYSFLETVSHAMGSQLDANEMTIRANWKIVTENTLEEYHVRQVHPETLYKVDIQSSQFGFQGLHSSDQMTFKVKLNDFKKLPDLMQERSWHVEDYHHQLIFPNMTIASAFGTSIAIQQIKPIDAEKTVFTSYVFAAELPNHAGHPVIQAFNSQAVEFNRQVFEEDLVVCEAVQEGVKKTNRCSGFLSKDEERILAFETNYMKMMREEG